MLWTKQGKLFPPDILPRFQKENTKKNIECYAHKTIFGKICCILTNCIYKSSGVKWTTFRFLNCMHILPVIILSDVVEGSFALVCQRCTKRGIREVKVQPCL